MAKEFKLSAARLEELKEELGEADGNQDSMEEPTVQFVKLEMVRNQLHMGLNKFGKILGFSGATYLRMAEGQMRLTILDPKYLLRSPTALPWLKKVLDQTGVNPSWLLDEDEDSVRLVDSAAVLGEDADQSSTGLAPMFATKAEIEKWYREMVRRAKWMDP